MIGSLHVPMVVSVHNDQFSARPTYDLPERSFGREDAAIVVISVPEVRWLQTAENERFGNKVPYSCTRSPRQRGNRRQPDGIMLA